MRARDLVREHPEGIMLKPTLHLQGRGSEEEAYKKILQLQSEKDVVLTAIAAMRNHSLRSFLGWA